MKIVAVAPQPAQLTDTSKQSVRSRVWHNVAVRLADEGVPVRAIMRSLMLPYDEVREVLEAASDRGLIVAIPRDEWPPGMRRDERMPDTVPLEFEDEHMTMLVMRTFKFTTAEAKMFVVLLRRPEVTKGTLHTAIQRDPSGAEEPSEIKIVDVYICKLRKKLPPDIHIETIWGRGYALPHVCKAEAYKMLGLKNDEFRNTPAGQPVGPVGGV